MSDFLDQKRREIEQRLRELAREQDVLRSEEKALRTAAKALASASTGSSRRSTRRAASPATSSAPSGKRRRGRPRGGGTRAIEALKLVTERPGITIPELAESMGIKQNYLYRVMPSLQEDGKVTKQGRGWYPAAA